MDTINATIPDNWFIGTIEPAWTWPHKEGIWLNKATAPLFCVVSVYYALLDIPETNAELTACCDTFRSKYARDIMAFIDSTKEKVRAGQRATAESAPVITDDELSGLFSPWVNKWAGGSEKMLQWAVGKNVSNIIVPLVGLNRQELRRAGMNLETLSTELARPFLPKLEMWVWQALLSAGPKRIEAANRELARRRAQSLGFNKREETVWITRARWWILIRVLGWTESDLSLRMPKFRAVDTYSHAIKDIDAALGIERTAGQPLGKPRKPQEADILEAIRQYDKITRN